MPAPHAEVQATSKLMCALRRHILASGPVPVSEYSTDRSRLKKAVSVAAHVTASSHSSRSSSPRIACRMSSVRVRGELIADGCFSCFTNGFGPVISMAGAWSDDVYAQLAQYQRLYGGHLYLYKPKEAQDLFYDDAGSRTRSRPTASTAAGDAIVGRGARARASARPGRSRRAV